MSARAASQGKAPEVIKAFHPLRNAAAAREIALILGRYRGLLIEMTRREISEQYAGQAFGAVWAIVHPLFMMALFIFIFGTVFKVRIESSVELPRDYTTYLLSGLVPWLSVQAALTKSCNAFTGHANLVKQVVFPIEILPAKMVLSSFFPLLVGLLVVTVYGLAVAGPPPLIYLLLPAVLLIHFLGMMGIALILATVSAFLRDTKDFIQLFSLAGAYVVPVFYLPAWVPPLFRPLLYLNPFSYLIWIYQDVLYFGQIVHPWAWVVSSVGSLLLFGAGYRLFRYIKPNLGNVL